MPKGDSKSAGRFAYDGLDRVITVTEAVGTAVQRTMTMAYDKENRLTSRTDLL